MGSKFTEIFSEFIGKPAINPVIFYSGKISGYITWFVLLISLPKIWRGNEAGFNEYAALLLILTGLFISFVSLANLGNSTRFGLPTIPTLLKTKGLYQFSRNPIYVGLNLLTIAAMLHTMNLLIILMGLYSIVVYHYIIRSEERFLSERFGATYEAYRRKVRRYL